MSRRKITVYDCGIQLFKSGDELIEALKPLNIQLVLDIRPTALTSKKPGLNALAFSSLLKNAGMKYSLASEIYTSVGVSDPYLRRGGMKALYNERLSSPDLAALFEYLMNFDCVCLLDYYAKRERSVREVLITRLLEKYPKNFEFTLIERSKND